jgi:hypothetical protein
MRKFKNSEEALQALRKMKKNGQTYSAVQVFNSAQRSEAWARTTGSAIQRAIWAKVKVEAEAELAYLHEKAAKNHKYVPCEANCEMSFSDDCDCTCGGRNHGVKAVSAAS